MHPRHIPWSVLLLSVVFLHAVAGPALAAVPERGFPLIRTVVPRVERAETQNFDVVADPRGVLYIANLAGVLVYDGAWWQSIKIGEAETAFSLGIDATGRVAVGGVDELGYLAPGPDGRLGYVSLLGLLPQEMHNFSQVLRISPIPEGFVFVTEHWIVAWDGTRLETLATFSGGRPYAVTFTVGAETFVWTREGLLRLAAMRLEPVPGGELFSGRRIDQILPAEDGLLISVRGEGLFLLRNGRVEPFAPEASRWAAEKRVLAGCVLPDGRWALGSVLGGVLLLRRDGSIDQLIDSTLGLPDDFVNGMVVDREGGLWLALNNDLARVEIASPLMVIDRRSGLAGSVYHAARHDGVLWAATAAGLFRSETDDGEGLAWGETTRMRAVEGVPPSVWSLLSVGEDLLVGTAFGVYQLRGKAPPQQVSNVEPRTAYVLAASTSDPRRVWVGVDDGLLALRYDDTRWLSGGRVATFTSPVRSIVESQEVVWCGTQRDGLVGVEKGAKQRRIATEDAAYLLRSAGRILVSSGGRVFQLDERGGRLEPEPALAGLVFSEPGLRLAEDGAGNLWINGRPPAVALRRGEGWAPELAPLTEIPVRAVEFIVPDDGGVWLASESGLFHYAGDPRGREARLPAPLFSLVTTGRGDTLFAGSPGAVPPALELPSDVRRLRIAFAPLSFHTGLRYEIRLDPIDDEWSPPNREPFADLTRLPPADYTFRVRTHGPSGEVGPESAWSFRVRPPWYQMRWAYSLGIVALGLALRGWWILRSRALRERAEQLEARVAEQTLELRHTVEELRRAQGELEAANVQLEGLSLQDGLTGVANRRRLQSALEAEWTRAQRQQRPIGFILLDLDHFKLLNDTRGHREGDQCLRRVAAYLESAVSRPGDLAARYGGEEFAVLLPETDLAGALEIAERLRQGLEDLGLEHDAAPLRVVTASLGVTAMTPRAEQEPEILIETADLALYRAKTEGRNLVRGLRGHNLVSGLGSSAS